ncbi:hypothetical protein ACIRF8_03215 [Streptomyces sp. NPDC102406]|uniref:hypothetical protein n=1 Tax=Streptomyces sp. NPDC102406 TaxID=3366171 RepID=UPI00381DAB5C
MRLRRTIATAAHLTAAATVALLPAGPASAYAGHALRADRAGQACQAAADGRDFPIATKIHEAPPTVYRAGGDRRTWALDLTNTTRVGCGALHSVLVLADRRHRLRSAQIRLEFSDGTRWRPVRFEKTGHGDHVGVLDDGFPGFSVGPRQKVTVRVRLAFTPDTLPGRVVATAALVQRRGDDGDWVGESDDYPFDIVAADGDGDDGGGDGDGDGEGDAGGDGGDDATGPGRTVAGQLAETGRSRALIGLGIMSGALLVGGGALVVGARRLRGEQR